MTTGRESTPPMSVSPIGRRSAISSQLVALSQCRPSPPVNNSVTTAFLVRHESSWTPGGSISPCTRWPLTSELAGSRGPWLVTKPLMADGDWGGSSGTSHVSPTRSAAVHPSPRLSSRAWHTIPPIWGGRRSFSQGARWASSRPLSLMMMRISSSLKWWRCKSSWSNIPRSADCTRPARRPHRTGRAAALQLLDA